MLQLFHKQCKYFPSATLPVVLIISITICYQLSTILFEMWGLKGCMHYDSSQCQCHALGIRGEEFWFILLLLCYVLRCYYYYYLFGFLFSYWVPGLTINYLKQEELVQKSMYMTGEIDWEKLHFIYPSLGLLITHELLSSFFPFPVGIVF